MFYDAESRMDELEQLMLQKGLLVQELELIEAKIKYINLIKFGKNQEIASGNEIKKVTSSPSPLKEKDEAIPMQTAIGKESTNPLKAVDLPKIQKEVQTSTIKLVTPEQFCLRPNQGIPIPQTKATSLASEKSEEEIQIPKISKPYYVVYNGPNAGIYEEWSFTKKATDGIPNISHKKFKTFMEARTSADLYTRSSGFPPLALVTSGEMMKPNTFSDALLSKKRSLTSLGRLPTAREKEEKAKSMKIDYTTEINEAGFEYCYRMARLATEQKYEEEKFYTTDGKNLSHYNFTKNANPEQVYEAFQYGLVKTIYPSSNLLEISLFPKAFVQTIKTFRKNCAKSGQEIFLKINSSGPYWNQEGLLVYHPQHLVQIGICKGENYQPSQQMDCKLEASDLLPLAKRRIEGFIHKIFSFSSEDKLFINYQDPTILIYSKSSRTISKEDEGRFVTFQNTLLKNKLLGDHHEDLCKKMMQHYNQYSCLECYSESSPTDKNNAADITKDPSTSEDNK